MHELASPQRYDDIGWIRCEGHLRWEDVPGLLSGQQTTSQERR
jgi:hypothetical protein